MIFEHRKAPEVISIFILFFTGGNFPVLSARQSSGRKQQFYWVKGLKKLGTEAKSQREENCREVNILCVISTYKLSLKYGSLVTSKTRAGLQNSIKQHDFEAEELSRNSATLRNTD